ncbi:MAG: competence/damage-inducible protein A [Gordonia sp. (in: high G+C Gram-positive bacteria)]
MTVRAGIVVTGTEVLSGRVADRNGPWVAQQLLELGVDVAHITICGDRPADLSAQLRFLSDEGVSLIVTTGGLGPTADDLTVATVAAFTGRTLQVDKALEADIGEIVRRWHRRSASEPASAATQAGITKQATIPRGSQPIPPTGSAPGVAIPAAADPSGDRHLPAILILPGPPGELQRMWPDALRTQPIAAALAGRADVRQETIRLYGLPEADLAETLRDAQRHIIGFGDLEITTCLSGGEVEMVTRYPAAAVAAYTDLARLLTDTHPRQVFSIDGSTIDDQVAALLRERSIATAESCTGGLIAARLTDRPGSSQYVLGAVVAYSNEVKTAALGVPPELIAAHGAVSEPVAAAMATGALRALGADTALSTSGIAGPGGGTPEKPVGTVCFGIALADGTTRTHTLHLPGGRGAVRARATTAALHLLVDTLRGVDSK